MCKFIILLLLFLIKYISSNNVDETINENTLHEKYPGYGDIWMYFPDGDGQPHVAVLKFPNKENARISSNVEESVTFTLFTRKNPNGEILSMDSDVIKNSNFDKSKVSKFLTHGWMSNGNKSTCVQIKNAYLEKHDYNVVIVDWGPIASNVIYPFPALDTQNVALYYAKFLDYLICRGTDRKKIHLIGHSLGAHVSGIAGAKLGESKVGRVTGLDPANPIFNFGFLDRLSNQSAEFVDVIHTSGGTAGIREPIGHADFYPNGGSPPQPGCFGVIEVIQGCSHASSWKYFMNSILDEHKYLANKCATFRHVERRDCKEEAVYMGEAVTMDARGIYYLATDVA